MNLMEKIEERLAAMVALTAAPGRARTLQSAPPPKLSI